MEGNDTSRTSAEIPRRTVPRGPVAWHGTGGTPGNAKTTIPLYRRLPIPRLASHRATCVFLSLLSPTRSTKGSHNKGRSTKNH